MTDCPVCGEYLHVDEEWALREGLTPGGNAEGGDYVHERCKGGGDD